MKKISFFLFAFSFSFLISGSGQNQASWLFDNYAGINSVTLNPALPGSFPLSWDLNLISAEVFVDNNYGFIRSKSLLDFYRNRSKLEIKSTPDLEEIVTEIDFIFEFYEGDRSRYANLQTNILGPSFFFKINNKHQVGLFTGFHSTFGTKIPGSLSYHVFNPTPFGEDIRLKPFSATFMSWSEAGINYGYNVNYPSGKLTIGVNLKSLQGYESFYAGLNSNATLNKIVGDSLAGENIDLSFGYSSSVINSLPDTEVKQNGSGFALDLGFSYFKESENPKKLYDYKIGGSINNLGSINFNKNAFAHEVSSNLRQELGWEDYKGFQGLESVDEAITIFSNQILGSPDSSLVQNKYRAFLPANFSLSADFQVAPYIFINTALIQPIIIGKIQPYAVSNLFVTPRFEHRWFGASVPLNITNYQKFNIGLTARIGYLILGTENIGSIFNAQNFTGTELFAAIKFNPFSLGRKRKNKRSVKGIKCYNF